jgi:hypothetical protein
MVEIAIYWFMTKSFKISDLRYKLLIVFKKMSVSQQKLFNCEYKIALRWDMTEKSPLDLEKNIVNGGIRLCKDAQ